MAKSRRFEDEDDDDRDDPRERRSRREPPPSDGNSAVKIVAIIGGVFLVLGLICSGLVYYVFYSTKKGLAQLNEDVQKQAQVMQLDMQKDLERRQFEEQNGDKAQATKAANAFLQEVKGRRHDAAYDTTTEKYRSRVPKEKFKALIAEYGNEFDRVATLRSDLLAENMGNTYAFKETMVRNGFLKLTVTMVKVDGKWQVDEMTVEPQ